jgi:hypothetical protein
VNGGGYPQQNDAAADPAAALNSLAGQCFPKFRRAGCGELDAPMAAGKS